MPDELNRSPAVTSLRQEQAKQFANGSDLNSGLEDTFPASDPVAITGSMTAGGTQAYPQPHDQSAPRVDAALAAVRAKSPSEREEMARTELRAMEQELAALTRKARRVQVAHGLPFPAPKFALPTDIDREVRLHPIATVLSAFVFGYVFGIVRQ